MADLYYEHNQLSVFDAVDDTIVSVTNTINAIFPRELCDTVGSRIDR